MLDRLSLFHDLKLAVRQLWRRPIFTLTAVLTLAIGMGVNAVAFTVANGLLFKSAAVSADVGRLATTPGGDEGGYASLAEYRRFADATQGALDLAAEGRLSVAWRHDGAAGTAWVLFVSTNYFSMVDVRPVVGSIAITPARGGAPAVVIGERFWRRTLHAAPLAGLTLRLNNTDVGVAGVLPEAFTGPAGLYSPDAWLPLDDLQLFNTSPSLAERDTRWLFLLGRLAPGSSVPAVQGRVDAAVAAMAQEWPDTHRQRGARFRLFSEGSSERRGLATAAAIVMGIIGLVLLLACFNVATLLLARAVERERDMGIRAALGAGAWRLARLVIAEGFVVAGLAGAAALVLARWTQVFVGSFASPIEEPQHIDLTPDATVVVFIGLLVLIAGVLPGLWPAITVARVDVLRVLGSQAANPAGGRKSHARRWLVGAQIAGSTAFLAIAALCVQSYGRFSTTDFGFAQDELLVAEFEPASHGYDTDRSERYTDTLLARVRALPGVAGAALAVRAPFFIGFDTVTAVSSTGASCDADACSKIATMPVGPGYFRTMGIALAAGREFGAARGLADVVINQPLAQQLWPDGQGLGRTLRIGDRGLTVTVIGITGRTHTRGLDREQPTLYVPLDRNHFGGELAVVVRTSTPPDRLLKPVADAAESVDPDVTSSVKTMRQRMDVQLWPFHTMSWVFSICGGLALILATVGLASVVIHSVNRRLREFGVRVSVGATPRDLVAEVLKGGAALLVPGLMAGTLVAAVVARLAQAIFVGVNVLNPATYLAVALLEAVVVVAACIGPALRAARVDPIVALRSQ